MKCCYPGKNAGTAKCKAQIPPPFPLTHTHTKTQYSIGNAKIRALKLFLWMLRTGERVCKRTMWAQNRFQPRKFMCHPFMYRIVCVKTYGVFWCGRSCSNNHQYGPLSAPQIWIKTWGMCDIFTFMYWMGRNGRDANGIKTCSKNGFATFDVFVRISMAWV